MSKGLKWFLGIVAGLVIITAMVLAGFWVFNRWNERGWLMGGRVYRFVDGRELPGRNLPEKGTPLLPIWGRPVSRFGGFHPLQAFFICLIAVGFIVLVVMGVVYLVRPRQQVAAPAATLPSAQAVVPIPVHACSHCGRTVQDDWNHCPYCGNALGTQTGSETPQG